MARDVLLSGFFLETLFQGVDFAQKIRGRFTYNVPMDQQTWLQVGGPVGCLFHPKDWQDLQMFLKLLDQQEYRKQQNNHHKLQQRGEVLNMTSGHGIPLALGAGSNLLVRDGGLPGDILVKLGRGFHQIAFFPKNHGGNVGDIHTIDTLWECHDHTDKERLLEKEGEEVMVYFGAGLLDRFVAQFCQSKGLSGLEFLYTIPGTIGEVYL